MFIARRTLFWSKRILLTALGFALLMVEFETGATDIGHQVKAAYLYKFTNFVEWPANAFSGQDSPLIIGIVGADALADELQIASAGHAVNGRKLAVRKLRPADPITDVHVLFIGNVTRNRLTEIYALVRERPILTVTDSDEAHAIGSMVNFVMTSDRLRFEVALKPVTTAHLKISALMLAAAYKVDKG